MCVGRTPSACFRQTRLSSLWFVVLFCGIFIVSTLSDEHLFEKPDLDMWVFLSVILWESRRAPEFCVPWIWKKHLISERTQIATVKRMDKLPIDTTEHYSAIKRKELLVHARTWVNLRNLLLSESSQIQKNTYSTIPFIQSSRTGKTDF